ncbi:MAG TPA: hypothetical protein VLX91_12400 [Candidatus Acidoferrales bacterium]|nr:hypothetical protein [Candidatus Acidoferrales bacterium]
MAVSNWNYPDKSFMLKVGAVACSIALFTLTAVTKKLFFTGGDVENFYFVLPTTASRFASLSSVILLNLVVVLSVIVLPVLLVFHPLNFLGDAILIGISSSCYSATFYFVVLFVVALLPRRIADPALMIFQVLMALILLAVFQLPIYDVLFSTTNFLSLTPCILFLVSCLLFLLFPLQEKLISNLKEYESDSGMNLPAIVERLRNALFIRSSEEEAGFLFFLSNIVRGQSFRLSTIATAATPVMVAIFWVLRGFRFVNFGEPTGFLTPEYAAPIASLVGSGIVVHYFLSQNLLSSKDHDAAWLFKVNPLFCSGKFVLGVRKSYLTIVHVPMSIGIFLVIIQGNSFLESAVVALTFYFLTHIAATVFSITQKNLPFTLPFTRISSESIADLIFMLLYSTLVTFILLVSYEKIGNLLMLNLFAFILVSVIEFSSVRFTNSRVELV